MAITNAVRRFDIRPWVPLLLFLGALAVRIPFRAEFLVNWDSVNFALGTHSFDLEHHQPHPPGYIGYIGMGWLLNQLTGDANTSLTWLSIISGAAATAAFFMFASLFITWRQALVTSVVFGLSPVVWYYSEVALTYSVELALALFFVWAAFRARRDVSMRHLLLATVLLVMIGAMRQSGALFLMPLWLYVAWPFTWRQRATGVAVLGLGSLAWLLPLLWLSGGPAAYMRASAELAGLVVVPTSIFSLDASGANQNLGYIVAGMIVGVNVGLIFIIAGFYRGARPFAPFMRHRAFFFLWLVPILLTYVLLHTGQLGYVLMLLPPVFLLIGTTLSSMCEGRAAMSLRSAAAGGGRLLVRHYATAIVVAFLVVANVGSFLLLPRVVQAFAGSGPVVAERGGLMNALHIFKLEGNGSGMFDRARQYNLRLNDVHWGGIVEMVRGFEPDKTAILTAPNWEGSFRHLTYYLPEYRTYGIGHDLHGKFGPLFAARYGTSDYAIKGLEEARHALTLPPQVVTLVVPDREVYNRLRGVQLMYVNIPGGATVAVATVTPGTTVWFE